MWKEIIHENKLVVSEMQERNMQDNFCIADQVLFKDV